MNFFLICCFFLFVSVYGRQKAPSAQALEAFDKWFWSTVKVEDPKLTLYYDPSSREVGVYSLKPIGTDEEIMRVPNNLMLTSERILSVTELKDVLKEEIVNQLTDSEIIAVYLTYLKACEPNNNPWIHWLAVLPDRYDSILYFNNEEMNMIVGTSFENKAHQYRERAKKSFSIVSPIFKETTSDFKCDTPVTYEDWRWSVSTVNSRKVEALNEEKVTFSTIVPYFDFFNHVGNSDKYSWGYSSEHRFFHTESLKNYQSGQEVFQFYGHLSNWESMLKYGFILENNEYDSVPVNYTLLGVDPEDEMSELKTRLLKPYREQKSDQLLFFRGNSLSKELLTAAQIINSGQDDFIEEKMAPKTVETEYYMSLWFQAICTEKLRNYPNSLREDEEIMRTSAFSAMSMKSQMAIKLRAEEKRLLTDALLFWKTRELQWKEKMEKDEL